MSGAHRDLLFRVTRASHGRAVVAALYAEYVSVKPSNGNGVPRPQLPALRADRRDGRTVTPVPTATVQYWRLTRQ
jgi:hypothetical protein